MRVAGGGAAFYLTLWEDFDREVFECNGGRMGVIFIKK